MRAAPAVKVRAADAACWQVLPRVSWAVSAAVLAHWGLGHAGFEVGAGAAAVVAGAIGAVAGAAGRRSEPVELAWDGALWRLQGEPVTVHPQWSVPLGWLVRARGERRTHWLAVSTRGAGADAHAFAVALHAATGDAAPTAGAAPRSGPL